jgi:hypothetical protein
VEVPVDFVLGHSVFLLDCFIRFEGDALEQGQVISSQVSDGPEVFGLLGHGEAVKRSEVTFIKLVVFLQHEMLVFKHSKLRLFGAIKHVVHPFHVFGVQSINVVFSYFLVNVLGLAD